MITREGESMSRWSGRRCAAAALVVAAVGVPVVGRRAAGAPEKTANGIVVGIADAWLALEVCGADVVRVAYAKDRAFFARPSLAAEPKRCPAARFDVEPTDTAATLATAKLKARVDLATGAVTFLDPAGTTILAEKAGGRSLEPAGVQGEKTFHVRQQWEPMADESLYGLGQHQLGLLDIKGYDLDLWQRNTVVVVPFLASSRGYGILWDNTSFTRFGDLREPQPIPPARLFDASGKPGGLTASYYAGSRFERLVATRVDARIDVAIPGGAPWANRRIHPDLPPGDVSVRWEGAVEAEPAGDYTFDTFSNCGIKLWIDDKLVIDHWRQGWLPEHDVARVRLEAGRHRLKIEWTKDQGMETVQLRWKTPPPSPTPPGAPAPDPTTPTAAAAPPATSLWSEVGDGVDYYFVYGPELDAVVGGYRRITGEV